MASSSTVVVEHSLVLADGLHVIRVKDSNEFRELVAFAESQYVDAVVVASEAPAAPNDDTPAGPAHTADSVSQLVTPAVRQSMLESVHITEVELSHEDNVVAVLERSVVLNSLARSTNIATTTTTTTTAAAANDASELSNFLASISTTTDATTDPAAFLSSMSVDELALLRSLQQHRSTSDQATAATQIAPDSNNSSCSSIGTATTALDDDAAQALLLEQQVSGVRLSDSLELAASWVVIPSDNNDTPSEAEAVTSTLIATSSTLTATTAAATGAGAGAVQRAGFFADWPEFGVVPKLKVVCTVTGAVALWGFATGIDVATRIVGLLFHETFIKSGASFAAILAAIMNPELLLGTIGSVMIAGVAVGVAASVPIFVIGSSGVFVSASLYHSWQLAKRATKAIVG